MKKISCHRGVALITVMLVVALAAILATQMTAKLQLQLQRSINVETNQQAYWYAMGAEAFAKRVLTMSFEGEETVTHLGQFWAQGENSYPIEYGEITGEISDLQSCFNLNALRDDGSNSLVSSATTESPSLLNNTQSDPDTEKSTNTSSGSQTSNASASLERLILAIGIENVSTFEAKDMADALTDWLDDNDIITNNGGAEDNDYSSLEYPYLAANGYIGSISELRTVAHFTRNIIEELKPYVCVIPNSSVHQINVNTISTEHAELLVALLDITNDIANDIITGRGEEGYQTVDEVFALPQLSGVQLDDEMKAQLVVDSEYFKLKTKATFNDSYFFLNSIMKIEQNNQVSIISRTIGRD